MAKALATLGRRTALHGQQTTGEDERHANGKSHRVEARDPHEGAPLGDGERQRGGVEVVDCRTAVEL